MGHSVPLCTLLVLTALFAIVGVSTGRSIHSPCCADSPVPCPIAPGEYELCGASQLVAKGHVSLRAVYFRHPRQLACYEKQRGLHPLAGFVWDLLQEAWASVAELLQTVSNGTWGAARACLIKLGLIKSGAVLQQCTLASTNEHSTTHKALQHSHEDALRAVTVVPAFIRYIVIRALSKAHTMQAVR
jgi:hypothetical protein